MKLEGEKLNEAPGEVGAGLLQLTAQQSCAALTVFAPSQSFAFFLQHSIADIPFSALPEKTGVPASTPEASAKSSKSDVSYFFIFSFTIFGKLKRCQDCFSLTAHVIKLITILVIYMRKSVMPVT